MITDLDDTLRARIVAKLGGPYFACALRATNRELRARIPAPAHCFSDTLLRNAALIGDRRLCILARQHGANDVETMLCAAACGGHLEICEAAIGWGAKRYREPIKIALESGHEFIAQFLARSRENVTAHVHVIGRTYNRALILRGTFGMRFAP